MNENREAVAKSDKLRQHTRALIIRGDTMLEAAHGALAAHAGNVPSGVNREKLDDELCAACALARMVIEAVADNAALLQFITKAKDALDSPYESKNDSYYDERYASKTLASALATPHPGTALLEELAQVKAERDERTRERNNLAAVHRGIGGTSYVGDVVDEWAAAFEAGR